MAVFEGKGKGKSEAKRRRHAPAAAAATDDFWSTIPFRFSYSFLIFFLHFFCIVCLRVFPFQQFDKKSRADSMDRSTGTLTRRNCLLNRIDEQRSRRCDGKFLDPTAQQSSALNPIEIH